MKEYSKELHQKALEDNYYFDKLVYSIENKNEKSSMNAMNEVFLRRIVPAVNYFLNLTDKQKEFMSPSFKNSLEEIEKNNAGAPLTDILVSVAYFHNNLFDILTNAINEKSAIKTNQSIRQSLAHSSQPCISYLINLPEEKKAFLQDDNKVFLDNIKENYLPKMSLF